MNVMKELDASLREIGKTKDDIEWCNISYEPYHDGVSNISTGNLYGDDAYETLYKTFKDINYDDSYGIQELFGVVTFTDDSWLERYEYSGNECWEHKYLPKAEDYQ